MKKKQQISTYIYKKKEALYLSVILCFDPSFVTNSWEHDSGTDLACRRCCWVCSLTLAPSSFESAGSVFVWLCKMFERVMVLNRFLGLYVGMFWLQVDCVTEKFMRFYFGLLWIFLCRFVRFFLVLFSVCRYSFYSEGLDF